MADTRTNRWVWTYANPPVGWAPPTGSEVKYMIWQRETAPTTGTPHIQGYVRFATRKRLRAAKGWFSVDELHMEPAHGTEQQNKAYCSKVESRIEGPFEFGEYEADQGKQGKRSDLDTIADKLKQGSSIKEVAEEHPGDYIRYHQGIEKFRDLVQPLPPLQREVKMIIMYGMTGTGKTYRARMQLPDIYEVIPGRDPWGTYTGQAAILFDEFNWERWTIQDMNRYCQEWRCQLDCRYKDKYAAWTRVVICANSHPNEWWPNCHQLLREAFARRITQSYHVETREDQIDLTA